MEDQSDDFARLLMASEGMVCKNALYLCAFLGLRPNEAIGAKWSDIQDGILRVRQQGEGEDLKTGNAYRDLPLPAGLIELLDGPRRGYISPVRDRGNLVGHKANPAKGLKARGFHRAVQEAGLRQGPTVHDLRHSCSTLLVKNGAHPYVKDSILGHAKQDMGQHYSNYADFVDEQRAALSKVFADIRQHLYHDSECGNRRSKSA